MFHYFLLLCLIYPQIDSLSLLEERENEFSFIKDYELIHFNLNSLQSDNILEFDAYGQHYMIKLRLNEKVSPFVNHQKEDELLSSAHSPSFSQCHFHGEVMNTNGPSVVSLSLCAKRGIRGMVRAFGETLYVYPSAYYLDLQHPKQSYQFTDEHLIYKASEYDEQKASAKWGPIEAATKDKIKQKAAAAMPSRSVSVQSGDRRRLSYNNGLNVVEMFILADKDFVDVFKDEYDDDWYSELYAYLAEVVSLATAEYEAGEWNKYADIGTLTIKWVELDIVEFWSGDYRALQCSPCQYDDRDGRNAYLRKFRDWSMAYKDVSNFDFGIVYSREESVMSGGVAWVCGMCDDSLKYAVAASPGNMSRQRKLQAHELGHSLCMMHDENTEGQYAYTCSAGSIMGTDDWNKGWSDCSYRYLRDFYASHNTQCLVARDNDFTVEGYETTTSRPTASPTLPTASPTRFPTITGYNTTAIETTEVVTMEPTEFGTTEPRNPQCVHLTALGDELNGEWMQIDVLNGYPVYQKGEYYFYVIPDYNIVLSAPSTAGDNDDDSDSQSSDSSEDDYNNTDTEDYNGEEEEDYNNTDLTAGDYDDSSDSQSDSYDDYNNTDTEDYNGEEEEEDYNNTDTDTAGDYDGAEEEEEEEEEDYNGDEEEDYNSTDTEDYNGDEQEDEEEDYNGDEQEDEEEEDYNGDEEEDKEEDYNEDEENDNGDEEEDEEENDNNTDTEDYNDEEEQDEEEEEDYNGTAGDDDSGSQSDSGEGDGENEGQGEGEEENVVDNTEYGMFWTLSKVPGQITWDNGYCRLGNIGDLTHCDYNWVNQEGKQDTNGMFDPCNALETDPEQAPCIINNPYDRTMCFFHSQQPDALLLDVSVSEGCLNEHAVYKYTSDNESESQYYLTNNGLGKWVVSINSISNFGDFYCEEQNLTHCTDGKWKQWISDGDLEYTAVAEGANIISCSVHSDTAHDFAAEQQDDAMMVIIEEVAIGVSVIGILGCIGFAVFYCRRSKHMEKQIKFNELRELELDQEFPSTLDQDTETMTPMVTYH